MHHETPPIKKMTFPAQTSLLKTLHPLLENSMSLPMDQAIVADDFGYVCLDKGKEG